jgi:hypothetical protein
MPRWIFAVLVASIGLGIAAPAQAAVTKSNVTSPADGSHYLITDAQPETEVPVTGTSNGTTGDFVDIRCYTHATQWTDGPEKVAVAADGSFSTKISTGRPYGTCLLRAVPNEIAGFTGDPAPFTGPALTTEWNTSEKVTSGPNAGKVFNLYVLFQGANVMNDYVSATEGGLWDSRLQYAPGSASNYLWYANADLSSPEAEGASPKTRSSIQVDGRNGYGPYSADRLFNGEAVKGSETPGLPALTFDASRDPGTGDTTIHETDPIVVCPSEAPFPPTDASCPNFTGAGVQLERTYFTNDGGRQVHISDAWRSIDGSPHTLSLHYGQVIQGREQPGFKPTAVGLELPWIGAFQIFASDTTFPGPAPGAGSLFVTDNNNAPDGSADFARGALSFDLAPNAVRRATNEVFTLNDESFAVPAGGTSVTREDFVIGQTQAEIEGKARANVDRFSGPAVSISSPANASTITGGARTKSIAVTGSASDNVGVASLTLNGASTPLAANGTFSVPSTLALGNNTFTAVAKDGVGTSATATVTVKYVDNVAPSVSAFTASPLKFRVGPGATAVNARAKKGTTFKFALSEDSKVSIDIARVLPGKRSGKRCAKPTRKLRRHKSCDRLASLGKLHRTLGAGKNSVKFSGRIGTKKLSPGRYVASIVAVDYAGHASSKRTVKLRVVRR